MTNTVYPNPVQLACYDWLLTWLFADTPPPPPAAAVSPSPRDAARELRPRRSATLRTDLSRTALSATPQGLSAQVSRRKGGKTT
jgi:hypothetical protein